MSYKNTFILVAPDCPVEVSEVPVSKRAKKPIHLLQYELLTANPYTYDHQELIFEVHLLKEGIENISESERQEIWGRLLQKGHPCLRTSALIKRYGFGAHYNEEGKIAIYPMESEGYQQFEEDYLVKKLLGMRSRKK